MLDNHGFDLWANGYDTSVNISDDNGKYPFAGYKNLMNIIYNKIMEKGLAKILDIGIGTGTLAYKLYENGNEITGIDFSNEMLKKSKEKMTNARLIECDFSKGLPTEIDDEKFDFITAIYSLHHLVDCDKIKLIDNLLNYLEQNGSIIIGDVCFTDEEGLAKCKKDYASEWDDEEFYLVYEKICGYLKEKYKELCLSYNQVSHCSGIIEIKRY